MRSVMREDGKVYPSIRAAAREFTDDDEKIKSLASQIGAVAGHKGYYKTAGGYGWEYVAGQAGGNEDETGEAR